ncbi:MAG TPA: glycosyltransferase family 39 protein [Gaiellaceae bacterium]
MTVQPSALPLEAASERDLDAHRYALGVGACTAAVAVFVLVQLTAWPPHEDETLALFVGRKDLGDLLSTVLNQRGGAPLHFLFAWIVAHAGGGLVGLRLVSAVFAVASVPLVAAIASRLAGRAPGLTAAALASASWMVLFHGVYGRMYSLFLFTSSLSYLALVAATEHGGRRRWTLWALATLLTIATHPYGALVLASQVVYAAARRRHLRDAVCAFAAVAVLAIPFWRTDFVLAGRFDVGVGPGGAKLRGPLSVLRYLRAVAGDFSAGYGSIEAVVLLVAAAGAIVLWRTRREGLLLVGAVTLTPAVAMLAARFGNSTSPESRHLIFELPFFLTLVAAALVEAARSRLRIAPVLVAVALAGLLGTEVAWGRHKTPNLYSREPSARVAAREAASDWLARTSAPNDVLFGYDPLYLGAWERDRAFSATTVPRADAKLALRALQSAPKPLGRGVWVFDASDTNNFVRQMHIKLRYPAPAANYEARVFGPFLVIRSSRPTLTARGFLAQTEAVMQVGKDLYIGDADINMHTAMVALGNLPQESPSRSSFSTSSR